MNHDEGGKRMCGSMEKVRVSALASPACFSRELIATDTNRPDYTVLLVKAFRCIDASNGADEGLISTEDKHWTTSLMRLESITLLSTRYVP